MDYDPPWQLSASVPPQTLARETLGIHDDAHLAAGDMWVALHSYGDGDGVFPISGAPGEPLSVHSPHIAGNVYSPGAFVFSSRLVQDTEPVDDDPARQFATLFVDVLLLDDHARSHSTEPLRSGSGHLQIELVIPGSGACTEPPEHVYGTVRGCLAAHCAASGTDLVSAGDDLYLAGPFALTITVLPFYCAE